MQRLSSEFRAGATTVPGMGSRLYRWWQQRGKARRDRYAEMGDEQREAISRYKHRPEIGPPGATTAPRDTRLP